MVVGADVDAVLLLIGVSDVCFVLLLGAFAWWLGVVDWCWCLVLLLLLVPCCCASRGSNTSLKRSGSGPLF